MSFNDFSSWPRDQEQSFVVYEQRASESSKKAMTIGIASAVIAFVIAIGIYAGVEPEHKDLSKDMNMSNIRKTATPKAEAPKAEAPKVEAPKAEAPAAPAPESK